MQERLLLENRSDIQNRMSITRAYLERDVEFEQSLESEQNKDFIAQNIQN